MNILVLQFFLLLVLAAATGLFVGWRWQRARARRREESIRNQLNASNRELRNLSTNTRQKPNIDSLLGVKAIADQENNSVATQPQAELTAEPDTKRERSETAITARTDSAEQPRAHASAQQEPSEIVTLRTALDDQVAVNDNLTMELEKSKSASIGSSDEAKLAQHQLAETKAQLTAIQTDQGKQVAALTEQRDTALNKLEEALANTRGLEQGLEDSANALLAAEQNLDRHPAQLEDLKSQVATHKATAETLRSELAKGRDFVAKIQQDFRATQQSLVDTQKTAVRLRDEQSRLRDINVELQTTLRERSMQDAAPNTNVNVSGLAHGPLDTDIVNTLPEPPDATPAVSQSTSTALGQAQRRIQILMGIVKEQKQKLEIMRKLVREMQTVQHGNFDQAKGSRLELGPRHLAGRLAEQEQSDNLQLIKGVDWHTESRLKNLGLRNYQDIAKLTEKEALWLDQVLGLAGAVVRQDWVGQSLLLAISKALRARLAKHTTDAKTASSSDAA